MSVNAVSSMLSIMSKFRSDMVIDCAYFVWVWILVARFCRCILGVVGIMTTRSDDDNDNENLVT